MHEIDMPIFFISIQIPPLVFCSGWWFQALNILSLFSALRLVLLQDSRYFPCLGVRIKPWELADGRTDTIQSWRCLKIVQISRHQTSFSLLLLVKFNATYPSLGLLNLVKILAHIQANNFNTHASMLIHCFLQCKISQLIIEISQSSQACFYISISFPCQIWLPFVHLTNK